MLVLRDVLHRFAAEATWGICPTGRYRCRYFVCGKGPPLVFIHGLVDEAMSFVMPVSILSRHFQCIAYNLPTGCGDDARLGRYQHRDLVADLLALCDHRGLARAYLFGSSFGSTVALAALHQAPQRFPRAVLQGGFAQRRIAVAERLIARLARYWRGSMQCLPLRRAMLRQNHHVHFQRRETAVWDYFLERLSKPPMAAVARRALLMDQLDLRPLLPQIRQPILMVCGDYDRLVGRDCEEHLLQGLPHVLRAEIEDCGHYPYFTHPEVLAEVVYRFLTPLPCDG
jgi:pimeloyl-ACP methyl ester carboxylesterase